MPVGKRLGRPRKSRLLRDCANTLAASAKAT
jgi:hypothetical protein